MILEQLEITTHRHYYVSASLLEQVKRAVETASTPEERRAAERRHEKMLRLHHLVEERYQQMWLGPHSPESGGSLPPTLYPPVERAGPTPMTLKSRLELPCHASHLSTARHMAHTLLDQSPADDAVKDNALLIVGELCTNVLRHAGLTPDDCYRVEIEIDHGIMFITVTDGGKGFVRDRSFVPGGESEGGRGLFLIEALSDGVEYRGVPEGGCSVQAKVVLNGC